MAHPREKNQPQSSAERLYRAFLLFQRRRGIRKRVVAKQRLSLLGVRLLGNLDASPGLSAAQLGETWRAERSVISRTVSKLQRRALIAVKPTEDGRRRALELTPRGREVIQALDAELTRVTNESIGILSAAESDELTACIEQFSTALAACSSLEAAPVRRDTEHPINFALMLISMCGGMYGGRFFGSALTVQDAQLLDVVALYEQGIEISRLARETAMEQSAVSRATAFLFRRGLLEKRISQRDRRVVLVDTTSKGTKLFQEHCQAVAEKFAPALQGFSPKEVANFCSLLEQTSRGPRNYPESVLQERIEVRRIEGESERYLARGFILLQAERRRIHGHLPESLVSKQGVSFGLYINNHMQGVCDCMLQSGRWTVQVFLIASEIETEIIRKQFQKSCIDQLADLHDGARLKFES
ncbi:MAG: MarR family transcriptional regulator [Deltaproteobacteria bacterium]|nr:MarR family transcriptional regulator [Deltaproteobacteria bacterium]